MAAPGTWASHLSGLMDTKVDLSNETPQSQALDERQVENNAGGFVYKVDDMCRLRRFVVLGSEGGSYYQRERALTLKNAQAVRRLLQAGRGEEVVAEIVAISSAGRAPKQGPGILALAVCCRLGDKKTKAAAYAAVPRVCRTASTLFDFVAFSKAVNVAVAEGEARKPCCASWGRAMRTAVAEWYLQKSPQALAYQVTKYVQRNGWSNRDLLRLAHPQPAAITRKRKAPDAPAPSAEAAAEEWTMVEGDEPGAGAAAAGGGAAGEAAADDSASLERQVADLHLIFRYVVSQERQPPPAEEDGAVAAYLRDAFTLKKGNTKAAAATAQDDGNAMDVSALSLADPAGDDTPAEIPEAAGADAAPPAKMAKTAEQGEAAGPSAGAGTETHTAAAKAKKKKQSAPAPVVRITEEQACELIRRHRFSREHIGDTSLLKSPAVWEALLDVGMPFTALVRNLGRMTALGMFGSSGGAEVANAAANLESVVQRFTSETAVQASRVHPITLLQAQRTYAAGRGDKGSLTWRPQAPIVTALERAFDLAFKNVEPTGKRFLAGLDISGSMGWGKCAGMDGLTPREAAAAMLLSLVRTEQEVTTMAFADDFQQLSITRADTLESTLDKTNRMDFGGTDCALPMLHAVKKNLQVDVFVVYTDSETWFGDVHPTRALQMYREHSGIEARLVVMAFAANEFSIADPEDRGMLDIAGLDSGVPEVLRQFVLGQI